MQADSAGYGGAGRAGHAGDGSRAAPSAPPLPLLPPVALALRTAPHCTPAPPDLLQPPPSRPPPLRAGICHLTALTALSRLDLMYSWKVTDDALRTLGGMTSLLSLNVLGCHRLTPGGKAGVAHLLDNTLDK